MTVLLVDDDRRFLDMLRVFFEGRGLRVRVASNVPDAMKLVTDYRIDGALTDYDMPQLDGLHFCREFRRQTAAAGRPPVWVMTGSITLTLEQALAAGAEALFRKPFSALDVSREIDRRLRWRPPMSVTAVGSAGRADTAT